MKTLAQVLLGIIAGLALTASTTHAQDIVHDAEYYILEAQNGKVWQVEDQALDAKLAELRQKYGQPPNIIHFMWDDQPFGAVGIPALQAIRGYSTPNLNQMASEGMLFTRMYSEPSCTPTRAAAWTGQHPIRNGMYTVGFPVEYHGTRPWRDSMAADRCARQSGYHPGCGVVEQAE